MSGFQTAVKFALRDVRGGLRDFRIFLASLALGVAAIAGVGSLSSALVEGLANQGQAILGGDLELRVVHRELTKQETDYLAQLPGSTSEVAKLRAMVKSPDTDKRTVSELKAVDDPYPLYGDMVLTNGGDPKTLMGSNGDWGALVEESLLIRLGIKEGDPITINHLTLPVRGVIQYEPDRPADGFAVGPRVMITHEALEATGLVQLGSLITRHHRFAVPLDFDLNSFVEKLKADLPDAGWRIQTRADSAPGLRRFVERTAMFLTLVGLTALVVGGVGVGNAVRSWLDRQRDTIATLKCLGAEGSFIFQVYLTEIIIISLAGIGAGLVLGAAVPPLAMLALEDLLPMPAETGIYAAPLFMAALYGLLTALLFTLWPLAQARDVPAAMLFRALISPTSRWPRARYIVMLLALFGLLALLAVGLADDPRMAGLFVGGVLAAFALLRGAAFGIAKAAKAAPASRSVLMRLAVSNLHRPGAATGSVVLSMGLGLTLLSAIALIEANMNNEITGRLPDRAPAFFFIDVQSAQKAELETLIAQTEGTGNFNAVPSLRGRITAINGVPADQVTVAPEAQWALRGDRGLTYAATPPEGSAIIEGNWWPEDYKGAPLISFDADLAKGMNLGLGDSLSVNVLGRTVTATISNLRAIDWSTAGINYSIVFAPGLLEAAPHTWLATLEATPEAEENVYRAVTDRFPNITAIKVREAIKAANDLLGSLGMAIRATGAVTILSGILVLAGAIAAGKRARIYDSVMLKVLGATRRDVAIAYILEYALLGFVTAIVAGLAGVGISYGVVGGLMQADWQFFAAPLFVTIVSAVGFTIGFGLVATWSALTARPAPVLRAA